MQHLWYLRFMYDDLLWPDLDPEPSLLSKIYSISTLHYILGVFVVTFGPKLTILWSLRLVAWKLRFWPLTWLCPDTWPYWENLGVASGSSHQELSNAASVVSLRREMCVAAIANEWPHGHSFASYDVGAFNPISGRLLATPISGEGGLFRTPPWDLRFLPVDF